MQVNVDGVTFDVPDDATVDEIDAITKPKDEVPPVMRDLRTIPKVLKHSLKNAANFVGNELSMQQWKPFDEQKLTAESKAIKESPDYSALGDFLGQTLAAAPMMTVGAPAKAGFLMRSLGRAGAGALQGAALADPGEQGSNAIGGAIAGPLVGAVTDPVAAMARSALPRAQKMALRMFKPSPSDISRIEATGSVEDAGKALLDLGVTRPGIPMRERRDMLKQAGDEAGQRIELALDEAHLKGAGTNLDRNEIVKKLETIYSEMFNRPGASPRLTTSGRSGSREAQTFINALANDANLDPGVIRPAFTENAKRAAQVEGYLKGGKYADPAVGKKDPGALFMRRSSGPLREATEESIRAVDPALAEQFIKDKTISGTSQAFFPMAGSAFAKDFAGGSGLPEHAFSGRSAAFRTLWDALINPARPYMIPLNQALAATSKAAPDNMDDLIRAAVIEALRQKENR